MHTHTHTHTQHIYTLRKRENFIKNEKATNTDKHTKQFLKHRRLIKSEHTWKIWLRQTSTQVPTDWATVPLNHSQYPAKSADYWHNLSVWTDILVTRITAQSHQSTPYQLKLIMSAWAVAPLCLRLLPLIHANLVVYKRCWSLLWPQLVELFAFSNHL